MCHAPRRSGGAARVTGRRSPTATAARRDRGYLGYDVVREIERLPDVPPDQLGVPDAILSVISELAAYDHWRQRVVLIANAWVNADASDDELDAQYDDAVRRLDALAADGARSIDEPVVEPPDGTDPLPEVTSTMGGGAYQRAVEVAKEHILAGDIFQVVLAQRFDLELGADPFDFYRALRQVNPSPYMYFLRHPDVTLVGSSPEPMVQVLGDRVISRPIAGTRKRGTTEEHDRKLAAELKEHPKEIAEHIMLVDLARNDVGRVVKFGTVHVDELLTLERYSHVMHLTSQVSGASSPARPPSTCCGRRSRPARCRARPRCGPWRSSTRSSRPSAAPTPAPSATSTSPATSTPPSRSARW